MLDRLLLTSLALVALMGCRIPGAEGMGSIIQSFSTPVVPRFKPYGSVDKPKTGPPPTERIMLWAADGGVFPPGRTTGIEELLNVDLIGPFSENAIATIRDAMARAEAVFPRALRFLNLVLHADPKRESTALLVAKANGWDPVLGDIVSGRTFDLPTERSQFLGTPLHMLLHEFGHLLFGNDGAARARLRDEFIAVDYTIECPQVISLGGKKRVTGFVSLWASMCLFEHSPEDPWNVDLWKLRPVKREPIDVVRRHGWWFDPVGEDMAETFCYIVAGETYADDDEHVMKKVALVKRFFAPPAEKQ